MKIKVRAFASISDIVSASELALECPDGASVASALDALSDQHPGLDARLPACRFALNTKFCESSATLQDGDELAIIPPVSGG